LVAQTYPYWECIVLDDGSQDQTYHIAAQARQKDGRIRLLRFETNQGRGAARQIALEQATGNYLAMLDADDWLYPEKLERQIAAFDIMTDVILISTGMAIADAKGDLAGVRFQGVLESPPHSKPPIELGNMQIAFPPSMIRMDLAKKTGFDGRLRRSEDWDFLLRLLMKHHYGVMSEVTYVYSELTSVDFENIDTTFRYNRKVLEKYRAIFPRHYLKNDLSMRSKRIVYRMLFALGMGEWMVRRRSQKPSPADILNFHRAKETVQNVQDGLFGPR
jgi:glycosyltransferase involved in cell wall biosynthesis